jgi:hypothetical protein
MKVKEDLKAYIDGELTPQESLVVREALSSYSYLSEEEAALRTLGTEIKALAVEPPVEDASRALNAVRRQSVRSNPSWALVAALLVLILAPGGYLYFTPMYKSAEVDAPGYYTGKVAPSGSVKNASPSSTPTTDADLEPHRKEFITGGMTSGPATKSLPESSHPTPNIQPLNEGRMVVQNGDLTVEVKNVSVAQSQAASIAKGVGGYVENSGLDDSGELPQASLTIRVPARRFADVMDQLKGLGEVKADHISGQDVTAQYYDTTARLKVLRAEEESYVTMLRAARRIGDLLEIKDRLSTVRQEIESLQSQASSLKNMAALSKIDVTFREHRPKSESTRENTSWSGDAWTSAANGLKAAARFGATCLIYLFVLSPLWIPVGALLWWAVRKGRR